MENNQSELIFECERLEHTITLAKKQMGQARQKNLDNKSAIISAKKELRENTSHSISNLSTSDGFEALVELSQYINPVTDKLADYDKLERKIQLLKTLVKSPYFARIDFKFDDEEEFEKIYIGRSSLIDEDSYEIYVYDWRSPIASVFYRFENGKAFYDAPSGRISGEVNLKRQFEINNGVLEYYFDTELQIVDEFLRKLLSQNTSTKMKTIIETIQKEQDIVIRDMENDLMMVQGVAGSGKTSIGLHRVAYLMYQGLSSKLSANDIIIISPNLLFEQYISNVLPELGEDNVHSMIFEELMSTILQRDSIQSRNEFLENLITNSKDRTVVKESIEFKTSPEFLKIINNYIYDLANRINFQDVYYNGKLIVKKEILKEKILRRKETPLGLKLDQLKEFIVESINESIKIPLSKSQQIMVEKDIQKFTQLSIVDLYQRLICDRKYFNTLSKDLELPSSLERILTFTQKNLNSDLLSYDDAIVLTYMSLKISKTNRYNSIKQVVIDEGQDYYPLHYEIFNLLFPHSKFTILGDINQTLEKNEDLSLYKQIQKILHRNRSSLVTMDKSFRCTNEILTYSSKFIDQELGIKSFNRKGDEPKVYSLENQSSFVDRIVSEIHFCLELGYQSIGLICKTQKNALSLFELLKNRVDIELISSESGSHRHGILVIPVYMSKGLEFDAVLICDTDEKNYYSEDDKKLLYIASTRALHRLNLFCIGEASPLL